MFISSQTVTLERAFALVQVTGAIRETGGG